MNMEQLEHTTDTERAPYEAPELVEYGRVEDLTLGAMKINLDDFPVGAKIIHNSGPVPSGR
jgi:hypothetical protein